jgi:hypothetical protein
VKSQPRGGSRYTKGQWQAYQLEGDNVSIGAVTDQRVVVEVASLNTLLGYNTMVNNALLITTAVNSCQAVNPDCPLSVAESIQEMYEALKALVEEEFADGPSDNALDRAVQALAKAKEKANGGASS